METSKVFDSRDLNEMPLIKCRKCDSIHFRHAGNVLTARLFQRFDKKNLDGESNLDIGSYLVYICIGCGNPWVMIHDSIFDATEYIDVQKWDAVNKALQLETKTDPHC